MDSIEQDANLQPIERRSRHRGRTFKVGKLIFGGTTPVVIDCFVIELSATGARVETQVMVPVPDILTLRLVDMTEYRVRRAWAVGTKIGLEILNP